jgi:hypothetical protein
MRPSVAALILYPLCQRPWFHLNKIARAAPNCMV